MRNRNVKFFVTDTTQAAPIDSCRPNPCGSNALCSNGACSCQLGYHGDPYFGCRPECVYNTDCASDKICQQNKCVNPCIGTCGVNAICDIINHIPMCTCPKGMSGNAFVECRPSTGNYAPRIVFYIPTDEYFI